MSLKNSYNLRIEATEPDGQKLAKTFSVSVSDLDEPPNNILLDSATIAENNQAGAFVGSLILADPDHGSSEDSSSTKA